MDIAKPLTLLPTSPAIAETVDPWSRRAKQLANSLGNKEITFDAARQMTANELTEALSGTAVASWEPGLIEVVLRLIPLTRQSAPWGLWSDRVAVLERSIDGVGLKVEDAEKMDHRTLKTILASHDIQLWTGQLIDAVLGIVKWTRRGEDEPQSEQQKILWTKAKEFVCEVRESVAAVAIPMSLFFAALVFMSGLIQLGVLDFPGVRHSQAVGILLVIGTSALIFKLTKRGLQKFGQELSAAHYWQSTATAVVSGFLVPQISAVLVPFWVSLTIHLVWPKLKLDLENISLWTISMFGIGFIWMMVWLTTFFGHAVSAGTCVMALGFMLDTLHEVVANDPSLLGSQGRKKNFFRLNDFQVEPSKK